MEEMNNENKLTVNMKCFEIVTFQNATNVKLKLTVNMKCFEISSDFTIT